MSDANALLANLIAAARSFEWAAIDVIDEQAEQLGKRPRCEAPCTFCDAGGALQQAVLDAEEHLDSQPTSPPSQRKAHHAH